MKFIVATAVLILVTVSAGYHLEDKNMIHLVEMCIEGTPITMADVHNFIDNKGTLPKDEYALKCVLKCYMQSAGIMNSNGDIKISTTDPIIEKCTMSEDDDLCQKAYKFHTCVLKAT